MLTHCLAYLAHGLVGVESNVNIWEPSITARIDRATVVQHHALLTLLDIPFKQYIFITLDSVHHPPVHSCTHRPSYNSFELAIEPLSLSLCLSSSVTLCTCSHHNYSHHHKHNPFASLWLSPFIIGVNVTLRLSSYSKCWPTSWSSLDRLTIVCTWSHSCLLLVILLYHQQTSTPPQYYIHGPSQTQALSASYIACMRFRVSTSNLSQKPPWPTTLCSSQATWVVHL